MATNQKAGGNRGWIAGGEEGVEQLLAQAGEERGRGGGRRGAVADVYCRRPFAARAALLRALRPQLTPLSLAPAPAAHALPGQHPRLLRLVLFFATGIIDDTMSGGGCVSGWRGARCGTGHGEMAVLAEAVEDAAAKFQVGVHIAGGEGCCKDLGDDAGRILGRVHLRHTGGHLRNLGLKLVARRALGEQSVRVPVVDGSTHKTGSRRRRCRAGGGGPAVDGAGVGNEEGPSWWPLAAEKLGGWVRGAGEGGEGGEGSGSSGSSATVWPVRAESRLHLEVQA